MIKYSIAGVAGLLLFCATPVLAENSTTTVALSGQTPNPSVVGQTVTLDITVTKSLSPSNCGGTVDITDTTDVVPAPVCTTVPVTGAPTSSLTGTCNHAFPRVGPRSLALSYTPTGPCNASTGAASQTVAAGIPTLTEWAMWLLAGVLMLGGTAVVARRTQRQSI